MDLIFILGVGLVTWGLFEMTKGSNTVSYASVPYGATFNDAESMYQLPRFLLVEVARQESNFKPDAYNAKSGATGIMQIVPRWHPDVNPKDPIASIYYAAKYLTSLHTELKSWKSALAAYNWGIGNVRTFGTASAPAETRLYVAQISQRMGGELT